MDNKRSLLQLLGKHGIELKGVAEEQTSTRNNTSNEARTVAATVPVASSAEVTTESAPNTSSPATYKPIDSKEAARNMLRNFRNDSKQTEMLDGMGYGDIAAMIQYLGPLGRRQLRNILKNRAAEPGIEINDLSNMTGEINALKDFMSHYEEKTPKEIAEFEEKMQGLKYAALLQDADRGFIKRNFNRIFSRKDESVNHARQILTEYGDTRAKRTQQRFDFLNKLREGVGKQKIQQTPENARGNRDGRNSLEQRNVPEGR